MAYELIPFFYNLLKNQSRIFKIPTLRKIKQQQQQHTGKSTSKQQTNPYLVEHLRSQYQPPDRPTELLFCCFYTAKYSPRIGFAVSNSEVRVNSK